MTNRILAEALDGIPQSEIEVTYSSYKMTERRFQKTKASKSKQTFQHYSQSIILVEHERSGLITKESIDTDTPNPEDKWSIRVHSMPATQIADFRTCLEKEGYAQLKDWFIETSKLQGAIAYNTLTVGFNGKQLKFKYFSKF